MASDHVDTAAGWGKRDALVIGAGLHGLTTAKVLLHDSNGFFDSVTIFEKNNTIGGVWAENQIYEGLTTNSPLLTYEFPEFPYPPDIRSSGVHVSAQNVNRYFQSFADHFDLTKRIRCQTQVDDISWNAATLTWTVRGVAAKGTFERQFGYVVICTGLYNTRLTPLGDTQISQYAGDVYHSSEMGEAKLRSDVANADSVMIVGAGKSGVDLATQLALGTWRTKDQKPMQVNLLYRRPHWLVPRKIFRGTVPFEKVFFSRFISMWMPYARHPDKVHRLIAESAIGKWCTRNIFRILEDDFVKTLKHQEWPELQAKHPLSESLSGGIHVEPTGFTECVKSGRIKIVEGCLDGVQDGQIYVKGRNEDKMDIDADILLLATGFKLALPFFTDDTIKTLRLVLPDATVEDKTNFDYIRLHRLVAPTGTIHRRKDVSGRQMPYRNIAFNGFNYSLTVPIVAHVTAHWISDYFMGKIDVPDQQTVESGIDQFHAWQGKSYASNGKKGVHIGTHTTLFTDELLGDMGLRSGHVGGLPTPARFVKEWLRPMYPAVYASVGKDRRARDEASINAAHTKVIGDKASSEGSITEVINGFSSLVRTAVLAMFCTYVLLGMFFPGLAQYTDFSVQVRKSSARC